MKYKLSEFKLNKQSLKRKLNEITNNVTKEKLILLLDKRTSKYELNEIEIIVDGFYNNNKTKSNQPLSIYYDKHNKEKFNELKSLIEIKKTGSIISSLNKDVEKTYNETKNSLMSFDEYIQKLNDIADKYKIPFNDVIKISNRLEDIFIKKIIKES